MAFLSDELYLIASRKHTNKKEYEDILYDIITKCQDYLRNELSVENIDNETAKVSIQRVNVILNSIYQKMGKNCPFELDFFKRYCEHIEEGSSEVLFS